MHHTCLPNTSPKSTNTIWANQRTCLQLSSWMEHHFTNTIWANQRTCFQLSNWMEHHSITSRRTQYAPTTEWNTHPNVFKMVQSYLNRAHQITNFSSQTGCTPPYASQLSSHWKIKYSSRPQLFTSTWSLNCNLLLSILKNPNYPNRFIRAIPPNELCNQDYLCTPCLRGQPSRSSS